MLTDIANPDQLTENGHTTANGSQNELSFEQLLDQYEPESLERGQFVHGEILQINRNLILADVDAKRTAVVPPQDLAELEEEELLQFSVGDEVTLYVLRTPRGNEDLLVSLNKGLEQEDWSNAEVYRDNEETVELEVAGYNKGGLVVDFGRLQGFIPASHVPQLQNVHDRQALMARKAELVGDPLALRVIEVERGNNRLILSAKKAQKEQRQQRSKELKELEGQTITGRITNLVHFGAFVDLDGIEGLIHVSEIAWQHVDKAADFLQPGEEVEVLIQSVDTERERISLSRKALLPSPWSLFSQNNEVGDLLEGVVTSVVDFGAFVLVADDIEGLIHVSEMDGTHDFAPQDLLAAGDTVLVRIREIQPDQQRLSLSQRLVKQEEKLDWLWQRNQQATLREEEE